MGDVLVVTFEASDSVQANREFVASKDLYDVWFKQQILSWSSLDFNKPIPVVPESVPAD
jgi:hypothetical protein